MGKRCGTYTQVYHFFCSPLILASFHEWLQKVRNTKIVKGQRSSCSHMKLLGNLERARSGCKMSLHRWFSSSKPYLPDSTKEELAKRQEIHVHVFAKANEKRV